MRKVDEDFVNRSLCSVEKMSLTRRFFSHCKESIRGSFNGLVMISFQSVIIPHICHGVNFYRFNAKNKFCSPKILPV